MIVELKDLATAIALHVGTEGQGGMQRDAEGCRGTKRDKEGHRGT